MKLARVIRFLYRDTKFQLEQDVLSGKATLSSVDKQVSPRSRREFTARVMDWHVRSKTLAKRSALKKRMNNVRLALDRLNDEYRRQLVRTGALSFTKSLAAVKRLMKKLLPGVFQATMYSHPYPLFGVRRDGKGEFIYDFSSPISDQLFRDLSKQNKQMKRELKLDKGDDNESVSGVEELD
jgi:hypothetical protein